LCVGISHEYACGCCATCISCKVQTGCLCKQKSSGRPLTAEVDVQRIRASFLHSPKKSTGTAAKELSMSNCVSVFGFLVINVCNHGERYDTPCMTVGSQLKGTI
jgi:hypothetical protein